MARRMNRFIIPYGITVLGVSHVITQITVIRECVNVTSGNELVVGTLFSLWLLLTGCGAWFARFVTSLRVQQFLFRLSLFAVAFLPFIHIILIRFMRDVLFVRGELPAVGPLTVGAAVLIAPYCLLTGGMLTIACGIYPSAGPERLAIGRVYFFDNIGDILGGVLFSFILVPLFTNLSILYVPAFLCMSALCLLEPRRRGRKLSLYSWAVAGVVGLLIMASTPLDGMTLRWLYQGQTIIDHKESPYGRIVVTRAHNQTSFFENGEHLFSTPHTFANEEQVHYALVQRDRIESVLLVSGGVAGAIGEIEKYAPHRIDYVELDPSIITVGKRHLATSWPPSVHEYLRDGRTFIDETPLRYDAVLFCLPDPTSLQMNRFYTVDLFTKVRSILKERGVVSFTVQGAEQYISDDQARLMSTLYNTLKRVFAHVVIIPGDRNVFIASDAPLSTDMAPLIAARNIETTYVNKHFLHGRITEERLSFITGHLDADVPVNQDFRPTAFYYSLRLWLSMFREQYRIPLGIAGLFFVIYIASLGTVSRTVFSTGFMASSMEVIILLCYQIVHGSMYKGIGVIIAAFMLGLAAGSYVTNQLVSLSRRTLVNIELLIIVYLLTYTAMLSGGTPVLPPAAFWLMALAVGALTGAEFPVASRLDYVSPSKTAGSLYAADLLGGSLGAFTVSLFLIPVVGIYGTCLLIIGAKILIVAGLRAGTKRRE